METYRIAAFLFVSDEDGNVDVFYGETWIRGFTVKAGMSRTGFIAECEDYFSKEMVFA